MSIGQRSEEAMQHPIGIVGAGRLAQALGRSLYRRGAPVAALAGRTQSGARQAASFIGPGVRPLPCLEIPNQASRVLIAVPDTKIAEVAATLAQGGMRSGVALHTCGAYGPEILAPLIQAGVHGGVLHPLQTITDPEKGSDDLMGIAFGIGGDDEAASWGEQLVRLLEGRPLRVRAGRWAHYHAGAAIACNGLFALIESGVQLLGEAGIQPRDALSALSPLCRASLENALQMGPAVALTGPIARGDAGTVSEHLHALNDLDPTLGDLYKALGERILQLVSRDKLSGRQLEEIERLLRREQGASSGQ